MPGRHMEKKATEVRDLTPLNTVEAYKAKLLSYLKERIKSNAKDDDMAGLFTDGQICEAQIIVEAIGKSL